MSSTSATAIVAEHVRKTFTTTMSQPGLSGAIQSLFRPVKRTHVAVEDVTFGVAPAELVVLLGPNSAGKSTLIKMLTGVVQPTSGRVLVDGSDPRRDRVATAKAIGVVFGQRSQLWWDLPARQSFTILQNIYGISDRAMHRRLEQLDGMLALSEFWDNKMRNLSLGQRVRADLAGALLHEPPVIFLDEPTTGMDVVAKEQVRRFLRQEVDERGCSVLLTTHDMNEVKRLGRRVIVIDSGRVVSDGEITELRQRFGAAFRIEVELARPDAPVDVPGLGVAERRGPLVARVPDMRMTPPPSLQEALTSVIQTLEVDNIAVEEDDLEDVVRTAFLHYAEPENDHV
ncbi:MULTISPECIES: ATP-binding cassette domain-containing protein [Arthrobacter]|uniref:ABC transporter ATP-binding protein n=1 Tax=Arthrobacter TaxID=1663 RepID=UPI00197AEEAC|nr:MULTISPECIES: ATP-binding cassette domain-containing protein [Arthrobacter]MBT8163002.1 ATP-binding cassette domain-containing protein [Arthrobacter sp. GN70]